MIVIVGLCTLVHGQTFKSTVDQVVVPVTIHTELGEHAANQQAEDFRVFDDGRPVPIVTFGRIRQSVDVVLLLDTSRSMAESLSQVRSAAHVVIARLERADSVQVGTFSSILRGEYPRILRRSAI